MEARITLEYADAKTACAVAEAIAPDNFKTPLGLLVRTACEGKEVTSVIECEGKLATFAATVDDLLSSASTAEKALKAVDGIR